MSRPDARALLLLAIVVPIGALVGVRDQARVEERASVSGKSDAQKTASLYVAVISSWYFEAPTGKYVFSYTVINGPSSIEAIETFGVRPTERVQSVSAPNHWLGFVGYQGDANAVVWGVADSGPGPANWDGITLQPSEYGIRPGESLSGFTIRADGPVGVGEFYAHEFQPIQSDEDVEEDSPLEPTVFSHGPYQQLIDLPNSVPPPTVGTQGPQIDSTRAQASPPWPNPAVDRVGMAVFLPKPSHVKVDIVDLAGRRIRIVIDEDLEPGLRRFSWNGLDGGGRAVAAGVYFARTTIDGRALARHRVVLLR